MTEQEKAGWPDSFQVEEELKAYLIDAELGTPKYLAFWDFYQENVAEEDMRRQQRALGDAGKRDTSRFGCLREESELRIKEMEFALLRREIAKRKHETRGYSAAYSHLFLQLDQFGEVCRRELLKKSSTASGEGSVEYAKRRWGDVLESLSEYLLPRED